MMDQTRKIMHRIVTGHRLAESEDDLSFDDFPQPDGTWQFVVDCVSCPPGSVNNLIRMIDNGQPIEYEEFIQYVDEEDFEQLEQALGYDPEEELSLQTDWHVTFERSYFGDTPVVFFAWSGIEHIFAPRGSQMLSEARDQLTLQDIHDYNTGKSILVGDLWYTVRRQDKDKDAFLLSVADFEPNAGANETWVSFQTILDKVNTGEWGFQHKDPRRGRQGWFGKESPRHEGRHDIS